MPMDALAESARAESELGRQLATLGLSGLELVPGSALQAVAWWNGLLRLGLTPPLVVVHDLGTLLSQPRAEPALVPGTPVGLGAHAGLFARYRNLLTSVAGSEARRTLDETVAMRDEIIVILLARLLGDLCRRWSSGTPQTNLAPLSLASPAYARPLGDLERAHPPEWVRSFLKLLLEEQGILLVRLEQIDLGAFRLFGVSPPSTLPDLPDLYQLANTVGAAQIADFSLQLLPSLLETKRAGAVQRFTVDGYASVERRGSVDAILPGELAFDSDIFAQRMLSDELLYYGHERPHEGQRRGHGILIDASASMRGTREVIARGLGLALAKKLTLLGGQVWLSFFDSQLHRRVEASALGGRELPYLLCFRSEQGRNYARVFAELRDELARPVGPPVAEHTAITFITHGECHIPIQVVQALRRQAALYGIFVLPSQPLDLPYLPLLSGHQVITSESITHRQERRKKALDVVGEVVAATRREGV